MVRNRLFVSNFVLGNSCEFGVDHDAAAVFTHYDFLVHLDFHLLLRRNAVEASSAGVALDVDDAESVASIVANALECFEGALVDAGLDFLGLDAQALFVLTGFRYDFVEFGFLLFKDVLAVAELLLG